jgi:hypothetical protein
MSKRQNVYSLSRPSRCHNCDQRLVPGAIVKLKSDNEEREALCRTCSGLTELELVLKGNQKITKLASKYSQELYVVLQWSLMWKCYERIGILAQSSAIDQAENESGVKLAKRESLTERI